MYKVEQTLMGQVPTLLRIGEKFLDWSDEDPPLDVILEAVILYWLTETFPTSIYSYRQVRIAIVLPRKNANARFF